MVIHIGDLHASDVSVAPAQTTLECKSAHVSATLLHRASECDCDACAKRARLNLAKSAL